ncbi:ABC transporter permease [Agrobacterium tumefaciens]|uniref:ABC transporter permease n=1 Tax=Agrobacterium tumefaciens TaxID=358 RepID=UPI0021D363DD|nr:ABC transporter permease [Agrobacterium tumefaciens]UXS53055.1 ABC transporter permease [Agrobacterium tumefaciens]UXS63299.1 ABC transporter permease [Agrobacterium tumefaciens]
MTKSLFFRRPLIFVSLAIVLIVMGAAIAGPVLAPHDPLAINQNFVNQPSSHEFLLGTDEFGRDILSRLLIGIRPTILVAVISTAIASIGGTAVGIIGAYSRPAIAFFAMRAVDIMLSFPAILLALLAVGFWNSGVASLSVVIGVIFIPQFARVAHAATLVVARQEFVEAEHAMGARYLRVVFRAILPNILSPLVVQGTLTTAAAILLESGLSFLGLGILPPQPSWGQMIGTARGYLSQNPMYVIWPSACLALTVLAINILGDALRDHLDPRLREN